MDLCTNNLTYVHIDTARECLPLDNPTNGIVTVPSNRVFNTATYSCNDGYMLLGQAMRDCGLDEMWTGAAPTCERTFK